MDSFIKAAKSGLAKTVAAGQQHLQQRLAKYEQSNSQNQGNQDPHQYFPPPPGQQQQVHYQQQAYSPLGQYGTAAGSTVTSPSTRYSYTAVNPNGQEQHNYQYPPPPPPPPRPYQQPVVTGTANHQDAEYRPSNTSQHRPWEHGSHEAHHGAVPVPSPPKASTYAPQVNLNNHASQLPPPTTYTSPSQPSSYAPPQPSVNSPVSLPNPPLLPPRTSYPQPQLQAELASNASHWTPPANPAQAPSPESVRQHQTEVASSANSYDTKTKPNNHSPPTASETYNGLTMPPLVPQTVQPSPPATGTYPGIQNYVPGPAINPDTQNQTTVRDDPSSVAQHMSNLDIGDERQRLATSHPNTLSSNNKPQKLPPVIASGSPREVVRYCPETLTVNHSLFWYHLPEVPEYLICTKCHQDHIESTVLEGHFKRKLAAPNSQSSCRFWYPRLKDYLWKQALQSNSLDDIRSFMERRLTIPDCKGRQGALGTEKIHWLGMRNNEINGFIACEACHEDKIVGTCFETQFTPNNDQGAKDTWVCDISTPYIARAIEKLSRSSDWSGFVSNCTRRLELPACEGRQIAATEGKWHVPRRAIDDFHVCGACYMDKLELTEFENEFDAVKQNLGFDAWMAMLGQQWTCKLTSSALPMLFLLDARLNDKDVDGFWSSTQIINKLVPCTAHGIIRGNWWTIAGGCPDFNICEACYHGIFMTNELDKFLEPAARSREDTIVCSFCPASPRFNQYLAKFGEALDRGVFSYYTDYIKKFASVLACPGIKHRENSVWWGYDQALFCEDCYLSFVADTTLADHLQYYGAADKRAQICQIWSPRMRRMWLEVCNAGAPGSDESNEELDKFKAFGQRRLQVFNQTVPRIEFILGMQQIKMVNAMHQGQLSLMYSGMESTAVLSGTTDGHLHGNSTIGWHETEHGATSAQMFNNMQSGFADANRPGDWMQMTQLQMMWEEVE
ncbi:hypothetical protein QQS21_008989 [Conoideocrella luteorostrata]|uniref:Integral membrane protein n=1 Tax=Conoideocrella luteorostrata TaxID=1105319 RepID=A0AAJ0FQV3_9HYPO|nr:hypothetical protein QQS21_008989 [Conoideocrella luteorostrata]